MVLLLVINNTGVPATLTDDHGDSVAIAATGNTFTGGRGGDFVEMSDCSDASFWPQHHMTITTGENASTAWTVSCWTDDQNDHIFCWSNFDGWSATNRVAASRNVHRCAIQIDLVAQKPVVTWSGPPS